MGQSIEHTVQVTSGSKRIHFTCTVLVLQYNIGEGTTKKYWSTTYLVVQSTVLQYQVYGSTSTMHCYSCMSMFILPVLSYCSYSTTSINPVMNRAKLRQY
jgi:hypothetical protein